MVSPKKLSDKSTLKKGEFCLTFFWHPHEILNLVWKGSALRSKIRTKPRLVPRTWFCANFLTPGGSLIIWCLAGVSCVEMFMLR